MKLFSFVKRFRSKEDELEKAAAEAVNAERIDVAKRISDETGCQLEQALDLLSGVCSCGIAPRPYLGMKGWDFTLEEIADYQDALVLQAEKTKAWQDWYVKVVCERTGWSEQAARARMDAAKEKGYSYRAFVTKGLCKKSEEELASLEPFAAPAKKRAGRTKRDYQVAQDRVMNRQLPFSPKNNPRASNRILAVSDLYQEACARVMEEMGWTIGRMRVNYTLAKAHCGCTFDEWVKYRLYAMDSDEQLTYVTQEVHLKLQLRWVDFGGDFVYFENKGKFNELFSRFVHRRWFLSDGLTWESFNRNIEGLDCLFVKDVEGIGGFNAGKYAVNESDAQNREVFDILKGNPRLICEECFEQHRDIAALYPDAVSTIRVFTFLRNGVPEVLFAGIRVGLSGVVDNLSSGGMMCGIDLETGKIVTHGATKSCEPVLAHPVTGVEFLGLTIPSWPQVMEIAKEAALLLPTNPYVGWDVAISKDGTPELIEGNHNPAAWIMQISWVVGPEVRGNRHIVDGLVDFDEGNESSNLPSKGEADSSSNNKSLKYVNIVCKATGWTREAAEDEMKRVRDLTGMPFYRYVKNRCWHKDDAEIASIQERIERTEQERVERVAVLAGWSIDEARKSIKRASALGLSSASYVKYACWNSTEDQIRDLVSLIKSGGIPKMPQPTDEEMIRDVAAQSGMAEAEVKEAMDAAAESGVPYSCYRKYRAWELTPEELATIPSVLANKKAARQRDDEYYFNLALRKSGLSEEDLERDLAQKREMGFSPMRYVQRSLWALDEKMLRRSLTFFESQDSKADRNVADRFLPAIHAETGWSYGKILLDMEESRSRCGASGTDYAQYRFWELTPEEQGTYLTYGLMQKARLATGDFFKGRQHLDDKAGFALLFGDVMSRKSFAFDKEDSFEGFCKKIEGWTHLFVKPINSYGGAGVRKLACNESLEANKRIYDELLAGADVIVDELIVQHHALSELCPSSVNTVRVMTFNHDGECKFLLSCLRMGVGAEVDNMSLGGLAAEVDLETGVVCSDAVDYFGNVYTEHPVTGVGIRGFQVPHWDLLLETCQKIFDRVEGVGIIGWDLAITEEGIDLIEGNTGAGYSLAQMPHRLHHRTGLLPEDFDSYLEIR